MKRVREENNNTRDRWEQIYGGPDVDRWTMWHDPELLRMFSERIPRRARVLDLGVGNAFAERLIARPDVLWHGVDHSPAVLAHLEKVGGVFWGALIPWDLEALPVPFVDRQFDLVMCTEVLEHMSDPPALAAEIVRCGKAVAVTVPNANATDTAFHLWSIDEDDLRTWFPGCEIQTARKGTILCAFTKADG